MSLFENNFDSLHSEMLDKLNSFSGEKEVFKEHNDLFDESTQVTVTNVVNEYSKISFAVSETIGVFLVIAYEPQVDTFWYWCHPSHSERFSDFLKDGEKKALFENIEKWSQTESITDILEKSELVLTGKPTDGKVVIVIDLPEDLLETLTAQSIAENLSVEEYTEKLLVNIVKDLKEENGTDKT